jgi:hypothetical protein
LFNGSYNPVTLADIKSITARLFKDGMKKAENISLAKAILEVVGEKNGIPYSNPNIYAKFISTLISYLNKSVIRKTSSGLHGILSPSEGMFEFLQDEKGYKYTMSDIMYYALEDPSISGESVEEKIKNYIDIYFPNIKATLENTDMEDTVFVYADNVIIDKIYINNPRKLLLV